MFISFSNDRYESGNSLIVVLLSLLSIYIPFIINSSSVNIGDVVFYGLVDGVFAWLFATLASWFLLTRAFNTIIEITNILIFTGYTHGILGIFGELLTAIFDEYPLGIRAGEAGNVSQCTILPWLGTPLAPATEQKRRRNFPGSQTVAPKLDPMQKRRRKPRASVFQGIAKMKKGRFFGPNGHPTIQAP